MRAVIAATVATAVLGGVLLLLSAFIADGALALAGMLVLLCVPLARNTAFLATETRAAPRALAMAVSVSLLALYAVVLR